MYDNEMLNGDVIYLILSYLHRFTTKNKKLNYNINKLLHCKKNMNLRSSVSWGYLF